MIRFSNVTKVFNGLTVLKNLSFEIETREFISLLGPSGIGKTTILRLITGAIKPDSGYVTVTESKIGYIFQEPRLLPWRTALENISLGLRAGGMDKKQAFSIALHWMEKLNLKGFENYYPAQLSGGMRQRVSIGRALAVEPDILLMDEPFSHLDMELKISLLTMLEDLFNEFPLTVVYVTHDLLEALRLSDRVLKMLPEYKIEKLNIDDREAIIHNFISEFIKTPAKTELEIIS